MRNILAGVKWEIEFIWEFNIEDDGISLINMQ